MISKYISPNSKYFDLKVSTAENKVSLGNSEAIRLAAAYCSLTFHLPILAPVERSRPYDASVNNNRAR